MKNGLIRPEKKVKKKKSILTLQNQALDGGRGGRGWVSAVGKGGQGESAEMRGRKWGFSCRQKWKGSVSCREGDLVVERGGERVSAVERVCQP